MKQLLIALSLIAVGSGGRAQDSVGRMSIQVIKCIDTSPKRIDYKGKYFTIHSVPCSPDILRLCMWGGLHYAIKWGLGKKFLCEAIDLSRQDILDLTACAWNMLYFKKVPKDSSFIQHEHGYFGIVKHGWYTLYFNKTNYEFAPAQFKQFVHELSHYTYIH